MRNRIVNRLVCFALACGVSAWAAPVTPSVRSSFAPRFAGPTTRPAPSELTSDDVWNMLSTVMGASPRSHDDAIEFFQAHSPRRFAAYNRIPEGTKLKTRMLDRMITRFNQIDRHRKDDSDVYNLMVKQVELQDDSFALLRSDQPQDEQALRKKVGDLVDLSIQERQSRIDRLEKTLADLKSKLESDKANRDALIDQHMESLKQDAKNFADGVKRLRPPRTPEDR